MKRNERVVGQLIVSAIVNTTPDEATIPDSSRNATKGAFEQLGRALAAFGLFRLGHEMAFVEAGIRVDVLDVSEAQGVDFDQAEFEAFVQRAHQACTEALDDPGAAAEDLNAGADGFAGAEGRNVDAVKALFTSMAAYGGASLISTEGEIIDIGVAESAKDEPDSDLKIEVGRIKRFARITTSAGQYDVPLGSTRDLQVGDRIRLEGVEPPTGAACIRADSIEADTDPTGELFDRSGAAEADGDPDDRK